MDLAEENTGARYPGTVEEEGEEEEEGSAVGPGDAVRFASPSREKEAPRLVVAVGSRSPSFFHPVPLPSRSFAVSTRTAEAAAARCKHFKASAVFRNPAAAFVSFASSVALVEEEEEGGVVAGVPSAGGGGGAGLVGVVGLEDNGEVPSAEMTQEEATAWTRRLPCERVGSSSFFLRHCLTSCHTNE